MLVELKARKDTEVEAIGHKVADQPGNQEESRLGVITKTGAITSDVGLTLHQLWLTA